MYTLQLIDEKYIYEDTHEAITLHVPPNCTAAKADHGALEKINIRDVLSHNLTYPIGHTRLKDLAKNAKTACIIISDATRRVPNSQILPALVDELEDGGIKIEDILVVVALGVHRDATEDEMREMMGSALYGKIKIVNHTPYNYDNLSYLGDTTGGTPVEVNKAAYDCDLHISVGKIEPHEFAGFTGGRKSVLPGISSEKTIRTNHRPQMILNKKASPGVLAGNPVHEDMLEAAALFRLDFTVLVVMDDKNNPCALFAGNVDLAHQSGVDFILRRSTMHIKRADIVVTTPGYPLNIDLYQALKPLIALTEILDKDSVVAFYAECVEGVGSHDMMRPYESAKSLDDVEQFASEHYEIQMDHSMLIAKILRKGTKIVAYSPHVDPAIFETMGFMSATSAQDMLHKAIACSQKANPHILFFPHAQKSLIQGN